MIAGTMMMLEWCANSSDYHLWVSSYERDRPPLALKARHLVCDSVFCTGIIIIRKVPICAGTEEHTTRFRIGYGL